MQPDALKRCSKCGALRARAHFHAQKGRRDGLREQCKECRRAASAVYYDANRVRIKGRVKEWIKAHPQKHASYQRSWNGKNPDRLRRIWRDWSKKWTAENPEKALRISIKSRVALRSGIPYAAIPNDFVEAKAAQIVVSRIIFDLKRVRP